MNAIATITDILREHGVSYESRADAIRVLAADDDGYEVALLVKPEGGYTVYLAFWHEEFEDEATAIGTFVAGLTEDYRLRVQRRGTVDYRWTIQYKNGSGWIDGSTVGLLWFPFFRRKVIRYLQNHRIKFEDQGASISPSISPT